MRDITYLDRVWDLEPESPDEEVWAQLPGGPEARHIDDHRWVYVSKTFRVPRDAGARYEFWHRKHPLYGNRRVTAHVIEPADGPRLTRLLVEGEEVDLPGAAADPPDGVPEGGSR